MAAGLEARVIVSHAFLPVEGCTLFLPHVVYTLDLNHGHGFVRIAVPIAMAHPDRKRVEQRVNRCMQTLQLDRFPLDHITIVDRHEPFE